MQDPSLKENAALQAYSLIYKHMDDFPFTNASLLKGIVLKMWVFVASRNTFISQANLAPEQVWNTPVKKPVIIVGLGRSGTTFLHRLMSSNPEAHYLRMSDMVFPPERGGVHGLHNEEEGESAS